MRSLLAAMTLLLAAQEESLGELRRLRKSIRTEQRDAARLLAESHRALDRGDYVEAVAFHKDSKRRSGEVERMREREMGLIRQVVEAFAKDLDSDEIVARDRSSSALAELGPRSIPILERAAEGASLEGRSRLQRVIERAREADEEGLTRQWANDARASSEYTESAWNARQATGPPDTPTAGDQQTAWASRLPDGGEEWLELTFAQPVRPIAVRVRETYNPGAVTKVEARDAEGRWHALWEGEDGGRECPRWWSPRFEPVAWSTREVRLTLACHKVPGWNEIDAVELVGEPLEGGR